MLETMSTAGFFVRPQAAAILKHGILRRYLPIFASKTGSVAGEVVYLDGFAGPGLYDDGSAGSPALALTTAQAIAGNRGRAELSAHLVEKKVRSVNRLRQLLEDENVDWTVWHGECEDAVPQILDELDATTPLFAFIDPFGLLITFDLVTRIMSRGGVVRRYGRATGAPTEILLNFSIPGINRVGGQLTGRGSDRTWLQARATMVSRVDSVMGGDWWQAVWRSGDDDRVAQILQGYKDRLVSIAPGWGLYDVPVSDRPDGPPSYHLLFLTQHPHGVWQYNESVSLASEDYRKFCQEASGALDLGPPIEGWVDEIANNIERRLRDGNLVLHDDIGAVYGRLLGEARQKHVRPALVKLYKAGVIRTDPKGVSNLGELNVRRL